MFNINSEGMIENIKLRGPDKLLEDEVERIIKRLPKISITPKLQPTLETFEPPKIEKSLDKPPMKVPEIETIE
ncbi:hypothetical protein LCGC14_1897340, partial [marine sediment metagenome]